MGAVYLQQMWPQLMQVGKASRHHSSLHHPFPSTLLSHYKLHGDSTSAGLICLWVLSLFIPVPGRELSLHPFCQLLASSWLQCPFSNPPYQSHPKRKLIPLPFQQDPPWDFFLSSIPLFVLSHNTQFSTVSHPPPAAMGSNTS